MFLVMFFLFHVNLGKGVEGIRGIWGVLAWRVVGCLRGKAPGGERGVGSGESCVLWRGKGRGV
jgi:hypothetical protein